MMNQSQIDDNVFQGIAGYVAYLNNLRLQDLAKNLSKILLDETTKINESALREKIAKSSIKEASSQINKLIDSNRGGATGLHGFIAEFAETGIENAKDALEGLKASTQILNNNGPADLLVNGNAVQMKYYANLKDEIEVSSHYRSMEMMLPKDHFEILNRILNNEKDIYFQGNKLSTRKINNIKQLIDNESKIRGESFDQWAKPANLRYSQVQKGKINETLDTEIKEIKNKASKERKSIKKQSSSDKLAALQKSNQTIKEGVKSAGVAALFGGGVEFSMDVYKKHTEGKEIWEYDSEDWKQIGLATSETAIKSGISGFAIYGLTNVCQFSAPSAGALVGGSLGLSTALLKYRTGEVDDDGFLELVTLNAIDATGAAIGATLGSVIIPVPVVGAIVGSISASMVLNIGKGILNNREINILNQYQERIDSYTKSLNDEYQKEFKRLMFKYTEIGELQEYAFKLNVNVELQFETSISLARVSDVAEQNILHDEEEIDNYFMN
jgi:hypothetical protein